MELLLLLLLYMTIS